VRSAAAKVARPRHEARAASDRAPDDGDATFWRGYRTQDNCALNDLQRIPVRIERIQLQKHGDGRGMLVALEQQRNVPFEIRRVYYVFATKGDAHRGQHAHRHLNQLAIAVRGSVTFLLDDGSGPVEVVLDDPAQGLLIGRMVWRDLYKFSDDCVLMVLADNLYDPDDYITDYAEFMREVESARAEASVLCRSA
jgi:dTDP-4-dehydrorhamnose 3,5-epimerase-like enzyme